MKKIALVMCFRTKNYGSMLQSFAMQHFFVEKNVDFECINFKDQKKFSFKNLLKKIPLIFIKASRKMKFRGVKKRFIFNHLVPQGVRDLYLVRVKKFEEFAESKFKKAELITQKSVLQEKSKDYGAVILGSDQVWHPVNLSSHFYDLSWVDDSVPRYAFSSSFGVSDVHPFQRKETTEFLKKFKSISTREKTGCAIVEKLIGVKCKNTIDPTLMFSSEQWTDMLELDKLPIPSGKYIFCYFLGKSKANRDFAKMLQKKTGMKIVSLIHLDEYITSDNEFGDEHPFDVGPAEFVNYIRNAAYVCTDSFHGTVFSLLYRRKVAVFERYASKSSISANSRILDLFSILGLKYSHKTVDSLIDSAAYGESIGEKLDALRQDAFSYLNSLLEQ